LARVAPGDATSAIDLTRQSIVLFRERRRRSEFVRPYYGSQEMNDLIIDFLLAAI
jgi:hypothetical protein